MKVKRMVKRLFAVGTGVAMLGATAMGAMAADLSNYPNQFVDSGSFNGVFVVGDNAKPADNIAMTDIATGMKAPSGDDTTTTTLEGDAWLAQSSGNFLELGEAVSSVEGYIGEDQLGALADGEISNSKGTADYEQFLYFDENTATVTYQEDEDDTVGYFYKVANSGVISRYLLDFGDSLESDIDSNGDYDDIEDKQISILGKQFTITTATNTSNGVKLVLMGGAVSDSLDEGESKTYSVGSTEYEVKVVSVTATEVQFSVNGELTNKLEDSESDVLSDGTNIGVTELTYQDYAGGIHRATFFLGADKLELENGQSLKVDEETISEAAVTITSSESNGDISIDSISVNMTADDDLYVGEGQKLSEAPDFDEPEVLFTQNWDIELTEVAKEGGNTVAVSFSESDDQADLKVSLYDGEVTIPLVYHNDSTTAYVGEDDDEVFVFNISNTITDEDIFFVHTADPDTASNDARSYLLQYKGSDDSGETNPKARIKNLVTGELYERTQSTSSGNQIFDVKLGGTTFNFQNVSAGTSDDFNIKWTSGGSQGYSVYATDGHKMIFRTKANHEVIFQQTNASDADENYNVWVNVDDTDLFDDAGDAGLIVLNVSIDAGADELTTATGGMSASAISDPGDSDVSTASSAYGELLTITAQDSGPSKYEVVVPEEQAQAMLYVSSGAVTSVSSSSGPLEPVANVVGASKLASEVADLKAQNAIVVGGPCVNAHAATLLGNPEPCTEGFTPGQARVKLVEHANGNVAMLVAGYSAADTRLAGLFLANRWEDLPMEDEVVIEGTTYSDATVAAPSAAPVMEEAVEEEAMEEDAMADEEVAAEE